jgi:hypothetical protein
MHVELEGISYPDEPGHALLTVARPMGDQFDHWPLCLFTRSQATPSVALTRSSNRHHACSAANWFNATSASEP